VYQPVQGTSQGSTYYVFALFPGLNLAARLKGTKMSIRAEGPSLTMYGPMLIEQFKMDNGNGYYSGHYTVDTTGLAIKALSAIVGTLGFSKSIAVADLQKFVTKGGV
jgi:hypothetical protein